MSAALPSFDESFSHDQQIAQLRIPPHSIEAESSVLGGLLLDNGAWDRVGDLLVEGDFYRYEHKFIYKAIGDLVAAGKPADVITAYEQLQMHGKAEDCGGLAYLNAVQKRNCAYCSYANGVVAYVREIAARTEQYWCPIKHARRILAAHDRYPRFFEYGDAESYRRGLERLRAEFEKEGRHSPPEDPTP
mgnify:CR=1 FL=1